MSEMIEKQERVELEELLAYAERRLRLDQPPPRPWARGSYWVAVCGRLAVLITRARLLSARIDLRRRLPSQINTDATSAAREELAQLAAAGDWVAAEGLVANGSELDRGYLWNWLSMQCRHSDPSRSLAYSRRSYALQPWPKLGDKIVRLSNEIARDRAMGLSSDLASRLRDDAENVAAEVLAHPRRGRKRQALVLARLGASLEPQDVELALDLYRRSSALWETVEALKGIARLARKAGNLRESERAQRAYLRLRGNAATEHELLSWAKARSQVELLENGYRAPARQPAPHNGSGIMYCLHNSLPYSSAGYAVRSHNLVRALKRIGADVECYTRHGFPWDQRHSWPHGKRPEITTVNHVDGVTYHHSPVVRTKFGSVPRDVYIERCAASFRRAAEAKRPAVIHAASNWINGLSALVAARENGVPFVYEVRGLWEVTARSRRPGWADSEDHYMQARMEAECAIQADAVITITGALRDEMVRRGVPPQRITIVPNSVDVDRLTPRPADERLRRELGFEGLIVLGYVGSLVDYEGLDDLLRALRQLVDGGAPVKALIVGDGDRRDSLKTLARELGVENDVVLTGRVPYEDISAYYSVIDIAAFPRKPLPVTEMVSPLKPYEAMALEKAIVASNVAALAEMVKPGETGLLFEKGSIGALTEQLSLLVEDAELRMSLGKAARVWVEENRTWQAAAQSVMEVHAELF